MRVEQSLPEFAPPETSFKQTIKNILPDSMREPARNAYRKFHAVKESRSPFPRQIELKFNNRSLIFEAETPTELRALSYVRNEAEFMEAISGVVEGKVFWDIGAAHGTHSINAALSGAKKVVAFEPDNSIRRALSKNIKLNNLSCQVDVSSFALGASDGQATLYTSGRSGMAPQIGNFNNIKYCRQQQVCVRRIDTLVMSHQAEKPDVVKIDVEGAEESVLAGLGELRPKHIFLEAHLTREQVNPFALGRSLYEMGYELQWGKVRGGEVLTHLKLAE